MYGGDMRNYVVATLCEAAVAQGLVALRFNFRGVGASQGTHEQGRGERSDVAAALAYLRSLPEIDSGRVGLAGYSFGAAMAATSADARNSGHSRCLDAYDERHNHENPCRVPSAPRLR